MNPKLNKKASESEQVLFCLDRGKNISTTYQLGNGARGTPLVRLCRNPTRPAKPESFFRQAQPEPFGSQPTASRWPKAYGLAWAEVCSLALALGLRAFGSCFAGLGCGRRKRGLHIKASLE